MQKCSRREAMIFLLGGIGCLGGCQTSTGFKTPVLPENCYWVELRYAFICLDLEAARPVPQVGEKGERHETPPEGAAPPEAPSADWEFIPFVPRATSNDNQ